MEDGTHIYTYKVREHIRPMKYSLHDITVQFPNCNALRILNLEN